MACCGGEDGAGDAGDVVRGMISRLMPDVPDKLVSEYLADAQRRFASRAGVWRYAEYQACVGEGDGVYTVDTGDSGVRVVRVEDVFVQRCGCADCEEKLPRRGDRFVQCGCCPDQGWWESQPGTLVFNREWGKSFDLRLGLVLAPTAGSDVFPPALLEAHQDVIKDGALAELYKLPDQEWTSYELSGYHKVAFENALAEAEREQMRDLSPERMMPNQRYRGGSRRFGSYGSRGYGGGGC